jgi:V8-like Glu-specific endopeptidase
MPWHTRALVAFVWGTVLALVAATGPATPVSARPPRVGGGGESSAKADRGEGAPTLRKTKEVRDPGPEVPWGVGGRKEYKAVSPLEEIVDAPDFLPVYFMEQGIQRQRAVGRITMKEPFSGLHPGDGLATGFLVSSKLLFMTNNHVIENRAFAARINVRFDYQNKPDGNLETPVTYEFAPADFFYTNPKLDFTLVRLKKPEPVNGVNGGTRKDFGFISIAKPANYVKEALTIIVQHPRGRPKEIVLHDSVVKHIYGETIRYTTDTEPGSSGSPVFNFNWDLIALHHAAGDVVDGRYVDNEGIKINNIVDDLKRHADRGILTELGIEP